MGSSIGERLSFAREGQRVGREAELDLFRSAVTAKDLPFCVLYLFGPGGVGKTTLLEAFATLCAESKTDVLVVDARNLEATPEGFLGALRLPLGLSPADDPLCLLAGDTRRRVLLVDTYENLEPLDGWLRDVFLPRLSGETLIVLAGRKPPGRAWRSDPGWCGMVHFLSLRNLSPEESCRYMLRRAVPSEEHRAVLNFTHGHPLALSLVADLFAQRKDFHFEPEAAPDMIQTLLECFVREVPSPAHRAGLETSAVVRLTTETLLARMLDVPDVHDLFLWLRGLSFVEYGERGLFPHDLVREALIADLRWRNPDRYAHLHARARDYYSARLPETYGQEQQRTLLDYIFLHRDNTVVRAAFEWHDNVSAFADAVREGDPPALQEMVREHEGEGSARLLAHWLRRQPEATLVYREAGEPGSPSALVGFATLVTLNRADAEARDADPATRAAWEYLRRNAPLRPGESATHFRFWMARDTYQTVSPVQSLILINHVRQCLTVPGLAYTFFACADPELWEPVFTYAEMRRIPEADFTVDGKRYGVFGNDWRTLPTTAWLERLAEKETAGGTSIAPPPRETLLVLSQPEFLAAVREAVRGFSQPDALRSSPLLRSRIVRERAGASGGSAERVAALRALIQESAEALQSSPRRAKGYRAVYHTYLHPAPTQEQAADLLDLPFSTYRRHLTAGIGDIADLLWRQETGSWEK